MATLAATSSTRVDGRPRATAAFNWGMVAVCGLLATGSYIDGWAHNHFVTIETFFTPWHALLYGGFGMCALYLAAAAAYWHNAGYSWRYGMPEGYLTGIGGAAVFIAGGALDMLWHILFGIEASVDALLSPTHLMLVTGAVMMYVSPLRNVVAADSDRASWIANGPVIFALLWTLCAFSFFTQYASPFATALAALGERPAPSGLLIAQSLGVAAVFVQAALLMGIVLFAIRLQRVPPGAFTFLFTVNTCYMVMMRVDKIMLSPLALVAAALFAGVFADAIYARLQPSTARTGALRIFAFCVPAVLYAAYFTAISMTVGTYWSVHLLAGCVFTAGIIGLLMSYLLPWQESR